MAIYPSQEFDTYQQFLDMFQEYKKSYNINHTTVNRNSNKLREKLYIHFDCYHNEEQTNLFAAVRVALCQKTNRCKISYIKYFGDQENCEQADDGGISSEEQYSIQWEDTPNQVETEFETDNQMETSFGSNVIVEATFGAVQKSQDEIEQSEITEQTVHNFPPRAKAVLDLIEYQSQAQRFRKLNCTKRKNKRGVINERGDYIQHNAEVLKKWLCEMDTPETELEARKDFSTKLGKIWEEYNIKCRNLPIVNKVSLDLYKLYILVKEKGGFCECTKNKLWKNVSTVLGTGISATARLILKKKYVSIGIFHLECRYDLNGIDPLSWINANGMEKAKDSSVMKNINITPNISMSESFLSGSTYVMKGLLPTSAKEIRETDRPMGKTIEAVQKLQNDIQQSQHIEPNVSHFPVEVKAFLDIIDRRLKNTTNNKSSDHTVKVFILYKTVGKIQFQFPLF